MPSLTGGRRVPPAAIAGTLSAEDRAAYAKLTKVWTPVVDASLDPMKIDLEALAEQQRKAAEAREANEAPAHGDGRHCWCYY